MAQAPNLYGYVVTYGKPAAELVLVTPKTDPLLAVQRYGLGRTAAFTSDLSARWGKDWLHWPQFSQFVAQLMRWVQRQGVTENFDVRVDIREGQAVVQADVYDAHERYVNHLDLQGSRVLTPSRQTLPVSFTPIAPGRYQGRFPMQGNGEYILSLLGKQGDKTIGPKPVGLTRRTLQSTSGWISTIVCSICWQIVPEARSSAPMLPLKRQTCCLRRGPALTALQDYWPWFVILALCCFILDIAVRQVFIPAAWTARWQRQATAATPEVPSYTYDELEAIVHRGPKIIVGVARRCGGTSWSGARRGTGTVRDCRQCTQPSSDG